MPKILNDTLGPCNGSHSLSIKKVALMSAGWTLVGVSPIIGVIPGPGGILVAGAGAAIILNQSATAKRVFIRYHRRYPRTVGPIRRFVQRKNKTRKDESDTT